MHRRFRRKEGAVPAVVGAGVPVGGGPLGAGVVAGGALELVTGAACMMKRAHSSGACMACAQCQGC